MRQKPRAGCCEVGASRRDVLCEADVTEATQGSWQAAVALRGRVGDEESTSVRQPGAGVAESAASLLAGPGGCWGLELEQAQPCCQTGCAWGWTREQLAQQKLE